MASLGAARSINCALVDPASLINAESKLIANKKKKQDSNALKSLLDYHTFDIKTKAIDYSDITASDTPLIIAYDDVL